MLITDRLRALVCAFPLGLLLWSPAVRAGWDTFTVARLPSGATQVLPSMRTMLVDAMAASALETPVTGRTVVAGATAAVPVGAKSAPMRLGWQLSEGAAGTILKRSLPLLATGMLAYDVAKLIRCYAAPGETIWGGLVECDAGASQTMQTMYTSQNYATCKSTDKQAVYDCEKAARNASWTASIPSYVHWEMSLTDPSLPNPGGNGYAFVICSTVNLNPPLNWSKCSSGQGGWARVKEQGLTSSNGLLCPSSIDPTNGANSIPAGQPVGPDGKCATARYNGAWAPATEAVVAGKLAPVSDGNLKLDEIVREALRRGGAVAEDAIRALGTPKLSGPAAVNGPTSTTTPPGGSPSTTTTVYNITYDSDTYNYTTTTVAGDGTTTTAEPATPTKVEVETCGLPGKPACKIDETGTPTYTAPSTAPIDALRAEDAAKRDAAAANVQAPTFGFIGAPPVAECTPYAFPASIGGTALGSLDPCGIVGDVRSVMAYLWALGAAWIALGWIRQTVAA